MLKQLAGVMIALGTILSANASQAQYREDSYDQRGMEEFDREWRAPGFARKLCSAVVGGNWRDTLPVPNTWTWRDCESYAEAVGATQFQLGCVFSRGAPKFSFGDAEGFPPERNCGWDEERRADDRPRRRRIE